MMFGRVCISLALAAMCQAVLLHGAAAQTYPTRPIKFIVAFAAGGPNDVLARLVAQHMSMRLKQTILVENRVGAGGVIGTKTVAIADPDGYTLLFGSSSNLAVAPAIDKSVDYDPLKSFVPVGQVSSTPHVLVVNPELAARTPQELVALAKANPGKLNFASPGVGTAPHLVAELFKWKTGTNIVHVPYKGGAPAMTDLMANHVQLFFENIANVLPLAREGKIRALATTGETRSAEAPDLPTMVESGIDVVSSSWAALLAPAGTPRDIVLKLNAAMNEAVASPELAASIVQLGAAPKTGTPEDLGLFLAQEVKKWAAIADAAGVKAE
jgi:tripartite-type tricarboxylate transporter receptor subunit TctC